MFSIQDKKAIQAIVGKLHDVRFINMEFIYTALEELMCDADTKEYIEQLQNNDEIEPGNDVESLFFEIFLCGLDLQRDISDEKEDIMEEIRGWLLSREEDSEEKEKEE